MNCPKCPDAKLETVALSVADRSVAGPGGEKNELRIDQCVVCGGIWFDAGELERYLDSKLEPLDSPLIPDEIRSRLDSKPSSCPRCARALDKRPAPNNPRVSADRCGSCGGLWLDGGELAQVARSEAPLNERLKAFFSNP